VREIKLSRSGVQPLEGKGALPLPRLPAVGALHLPIHPGEGGPAALPRKGAVLGKTLLTARLQGPDQPL
jgi:hypothetical protein